MNTTKSFTFTAVFLTVLVFSFCKKEPAVELPASDSAEVPLLPESVHDYPSSNNDHLATLGRVLFYDKELSLNKNISCGSCHKQEKAFTDNLQFSPGTDNRKTTRNTPSIFPKNGRLFWDGRSGSLVDLALMPVRNEVEMNIQNIPHLVQRISNLDYYTYLFKRAFPNHRHIDSNMIKNALAEFLRNFNFSNNKFHRSERGEAQLSDSEQRGKSLFFGKARCSQCHHILPEGFGQQNSGYGNTDHSRNIGLDEIPSDAGVGDITGNQHDRGAFMMPVLLNVEFTAPYMHDGRFKTLEEVIEHYNSGIKNSPALDPILKSGNGSQPLKLNLQDSEKKALLDFLKTLSDHSVFNDPKFSDPFVPRQK
jgi:cytochrome c peroxidase